jgi:RND family efflux transporter MFP subunit
MRHSWMIVLLVLLAGCGGGGGMDGKGWGGGNEEERKDPLVEVVPARRDNISRFERSTGRVESHDLADVYAQVTEVATAVLADVGDEVQAGQVLARLDRSKTELAVAATLIAVQEAELAHRKDELDATKRRTDFERIQKYFDPNNPTESKLYSKDAYDAAKLEYDKSINQAQTSRLALDKAQGELAAQQLQLQHTVIQAPISGVIIERSVRNNVLVTSNALAFRIADFSKLEVKLDVAEASLSDLREPARIPSIGLFGLREKVDMNSAQAVLLSVTAFPNARFLGYVDRISPTVDETRGMIVATVRIVQPVEFEPLTHAPLLEQMDPDARKAIEDTVARVTKGERLAIRPGMWVDARISTKVEKNVLLVPGAAMVGDDEVIWVIDTQDAETGTARRIDVSRRRGVNSEGSFELQDAPTKADKGQDVKEGTLIVVRGQSLLRDGQKVRVRDLTK